MFDKSKVGTSFPPFSIEIERSKIHELALAVGDDDPVYHSREAAQAAGYRDMPLFPTTPTVFTFWGHTDLFKQLASTGINVRGILHAEEEYEYLAPIYAGDRLNGITKIVDGKTRGTTDILVTETRYTNQDNQPVLSARTMMVVRE